MNESISNNLFMWGVFLFTAAVALLLVFVLTDSGNWNSDDEDNDDPYL